MDEITPEEKQHIGELAIEARLLYEDVLAWMEEQPWPPEVAHKPRKEDAPMWRESAIAQTRFRAALDELLDLAPLTEVGPRFQREANHA